MNERKNSLKIGRSVSKILNHLGNKFNSMEFEIFKGKPKLV